MIEKPLIPLAPVTKATLLDDCVLMVLVFPWVQCSLIFEGFHKIGSKSRVKLGSTPRL